jgi:hypothetical protein
MTVDLPNAVPVTASWYTELPDGYCRIGISRGTPRGQRSFKLGQLDPTATLAELSALASGLKPALLCFERAPPDPSWCHRALVSAWFYDTIGISVFEFGHESDGAGWTHPVGGGTRGGLIIHPNG